MAWSSAGRCGALARGSLIARELVAQRLVRYGKLVSPENVIAGSDCGFATFASFLTVEPDITWAKLRAMAEGAALASKELYVNH